MRPSGISLGFPRLSPSHGQLDYVLLARPPLYSSCDFHVRLACLIHAANVRSEPGSNPSLWKMFVQCLPTAFAAGGWQARSHPEGQDLPAFFTYSHARLRGHPVCQRSSASGFSAVSGAGEGSECRLPVKLSSRKISQTSENKPGKALTSPPNGCGPSVGNNSTGPRCAPWLADRGPASGASAPLPHCFLGPSVRWGPSSSQHPPTEPSSSRGLPPSPCGGAGGRAP